MTSPDHGSKVFAAWRASAGDDWRGYTRHPLVEGLADGSLPPGAFHNYLAQDYIFLTHFARAWAFAVVKAATIDEMRAASGIVNALVNDEMKLHIETCAAVGLDEKALSAAREAPENLAYTRYVLDAGLSGDLLDLLAALAPCVLGYGEIGARLAEEASSSTYRAWIASYGGREYRDVCRRTARLIEDASRTRLGEDFLASPRWPELARRFETATRLEVGFFDMGLRQHP